MDILKAFRLIAPEFDAIKDKQVKNYICLFSTMVSREKFGQQYTLAMAYYVAHKMKMHGLSGNEDDARTNAAVNMGVASYSEGGTSISYANPASSGSTDTDAELTLTVYGIEYMRILRSCIISAVI